MGARVQKGDVLAELYVPEMDVELKQKEAGIRQAASEIELARATFEQAIAYANDVGLLAEEVDPATGELLGNFPQAFSHIGLVNAAWAISQAQ